MNGPREKIMQHETEGKSRRSGKILVICTFVGAPFAKFGSSDFNNIDSSLTSYVKTF